MRILKMSTIEEYKCRLIYEEKSPSTVQKYVRDAAAFCKWLDGREVDKSYVLEYKEKLISEYADASVNSIISSLNSLFAYLGWHDCTIKMLKLQKTIFIDKSKELNKAEYERLLKAASKKNIRLYYVMQTICSTGIRVSEDIYCKG